MGLFFQHHSIVQSLTLTLVLRAPSKQKVCKVFLSDLMLTSMRDIVFLFLELFTFVCMYVLGLIELELSLKLWFWLNNENDRRSMFPYLDSYVYVL